ncbi:plant intracellular Ras-group-related LRR protein 6 isoform X2 [Capsicum annuum]|uniref:plant intracellular Ras-group-related LRR protein 6 isoform X2 n=1 Tax=Capsicum annuum TaxID=4072 RepID=UPI001FB0A7C4|nr:plant intracellular Ras-group-related LRR protein 6 isoform X2 [Capsicum annuum]
MDRVLKAARTSGSLNLSNRSLSEVPTDIYKSLDATSEDVKWWEAVELQKLILAHNNIETLQEDLRNLPLLSVLNVSHNKLTHLPAAIGELHMLKSLDVSFNLIVNIPEEIGTAASLVKFDCSNNQLNDLPNSLGRCVELANLKASNNSISSLPADLAKCSKLTKLDVEGNELTSLPESLMASCRMLTELNASKNLLNSIPENIGSLSRLIRLDLNQNRISSIPSSIKDCSSLLEFYIGNNALVSLPVEIGTLNRLGIFDLHSNQLKEYPAAACKLQLSMLDLSNNSLSGLPPEIGLMTTLRKLVLVGNPIRTLRSSLVNGPTPALLRFLRSRLPTDEESATSTPGKEDVVAMAARLSLSSKELSLAGLGLTAVPSDVWNSSDISKCDLSRNSIEELPLELCSCITLEIPSSAFQAVSKLQVLDLSGNKCSLPEHPAFSCLPELQELYLRRMQISIFPSDILNLKQLRILDLSQNSLQSIPQGIVNLTSLAELDVSDNNISSLPPELGLLEPSLQVLKLDGNPLRSIRRAILDRGTKGVLTYLKERIVEH